MSPGELLPVEDALRIVADTTPLMPLESVPPTEAGGRPLAAPVVAPLDLPPFDNSAVDGYALHPDDIGAAPLTLCVGGAVAAGGEVGDALLPGRTMRVMTGGRVPTAAGAIVKREDVTEIEGRAEVREGVRPGANIRRRGEEIRAGEVAIEAGGLVNPGAFGLLIALGVRSVSVRRRPRVAILATGNELVPAGEELAPGCIHDSSTPSLSRLVESAGALAVPLPIARDDRAQLSERLREGLEHDVLISTGGVSVGDYDFVKETLEALGVEIRFWRVEMKPGKPLVYGTRGEVRAFGLPGNPGSSLVTFERFVRPALRRMVGDPGWSPVETEATLVAPCRNRGSRTRFLRARLEWSGGALLASPLSAQGSGTWRSLAAANGFIVLPPAAGGREAGDRVTVQPLPEIYGRVGGGGPVQAS